MNTASTQNLLVTPPPYLGSASCWRRYPEKHKKTKVHTVLARAMLSKRCINETINDPLKSIYQIEYSRHRRLHGFMLN
uniref:transposase n=1 Tax=Photobacterium pectinilyticum TaxID=2906793 RepID=UPI00359F42EC